MVAEERMQKAGQKPSGELRDDGGSGNNKRRKKIAIATELLGSLMPSGQ